MTTINQVFEYLKELVPLELQMSFDNAGFLVGHGDTAVSRIITALDITEDVINEAISEKAELIVSHHPVIFHPAKSVTDGDDTGVKILMLAENRIAAICMHTNLDIAEGGVNDILIDKLGAEKCGTLDESGCGRIGMMRMEMSFDAFLVYTKHVLNANGLRYYSAGKPVRKLAVMGGAGADAIRTASELGCDTYVTADIKYHEFQLAQSLGINIIDADHFCTEDPVIADITEKLSATFPEILVKKSAVHRQLVQFA